MYSTKAARSLKNLFAGYHEPPSLSAQQSQKLLDGLKASFRDQLDREYGRAPGSTPTPVVEKVIDTEAPPPVARRSAANQHLKHLLSNPLFSYHKEPIVKVAAPDVLTTKRDPMDVFDHAVAKGMMNIKAATGCMIAKRQQLQTTSDSTGVKVPDADVARRVIRWLNWSRPESDLAFLDKKPFVQALMPFAVSEGLEHVIWEWLARSMNDISGALPDDVRLQRASNLLAGLVRIQSQPQHGNLDAAITTLLNAEQLYEANPLLSKLLVQPWRSISWLSTVESYSRSAPSEQLFNAHMAAADRLSRPVEAEKAHLHLYHPTHPDHTYALQFFQDTGKLRKLVSGLTPEKLSSAKSRGMGIIPWVAVLGHDTVNYLLKSGRSQEAEGMNDLLQSELAALFSNTPKPT